MDEATKDRVLYEIFALGYHQANPELPDFLVELAWNNVRNISRSRPGGDSIQMIKDRLC